MTLETVTVADAVAGELRRRLLAGEYTGGEELRDTDLTAEFGAARPTIRAAVQTLVADGLLERGRGRSARVRSFTAADAVDLYRLRRPIELAAVRLVVQERSPLDRVQAALAEFSALPDRVSWDRVADADIAFHRAVLAAAGAPRLLRTFNEAGAELRLLIAQLRPAYRGAGQIAAEHDVLLSALRSGRKREAVQAWKEHLDSAEHFFLDLIAERDQ
ncbi:MAG TPA: GntR family transcriptional regulator [Streptosporangiaceae bacterium]|jgi:DNA-binding GntR family transcriptional regulator|nr:GntR family transcriptional regulator [Streptosporangiaceae bacterium]